METEVGIDARNISMEGRHKGLVTYQIQKINTTWHLKEENLSGFSLVFWYICVFNWKKKTSQWCLQSFDKDSWENGDAVD